MKIDTEGTEHAVLAGAGELLRCERPIIVYELLPRAQTAPIVALAADLGYVNFRLRPTEIVVGLPIAFDEAGWNHALVPEASLGVVESAAARLGLSFVTAGAR